MLKFIAKITTATFLAFAPSAALSLGPMEAGVLNPTQPGWIGAIPGQNPLTADEATATIAFFLVSQYYCPDVASMDNLNVAGLQADVAAGGNDINDFLEGGKFGDNVVGLMDQLYDDYPEVMMKMFCPMNPYLN